MRILALSPHPDDVEMSCGGFLAKHEEDDILIVYFSLCDESMKDFPADTLSGELRNVSKVLNAGCEVMGYTVRRFSESRQAILESIIRIRDDFNPDLVLIPSGADIHQDHKVIHDEGKRAFKHYNTLAYDLPWNCRGFAPDHFEVLSDSEVEKKMEMISCYQSQVKLKRTYFRDDIIKANMMLRGLQCGSKYAEAFESITWIN